MSDPLHVERWGPAGPGSAEVGSPAAADRAVDHAAGAAGEADGTAPLPGPEGPPAFYFDFRDPESYLAAERVLTTLPVATPWVPVDGTRLPGPEGFGGFLCPTDEEAARDRIERTAAHRGMQPLRWPVEVPFDSTLALRAAWYAKGIGRIVSFALPAFRQAYAGGHDLSGEDFVLLAASACEMHPRAVSQALRRPAIIRGLQEATDRAAARGVARTPAVWIGDRVFHGDDGLDEAAAALVARTSE